MDIRHQTNKQNNNKKFMICLMRMLEKMDPI